MSEPGRAARRAWRLAASLCAGLALSSLALAVLAKEVPYLTGRVNDQAELLPPDAEARIESLLGEIERATGAQVAVLTVPGLEGEALEDYTLRVAETWKLGRGQFDDGALLFVAKDDRKLRLEVGYGLEEVLPDALARRILDEVVKPRFKSGDFAGGVEEGVKVIASTIEGKGTLPPPAESPGSGAVSLPAIPGVLLFAAVFGLPLGLFSLGALRSHGFGAWFLYLFLTPFWGGIPYTFLGKVAGIVGLALWLLGFPLARLLLGRTKAGKRFLEPAPAHASGRASGRGSRGGGWWSSGGGGWSGGGGSSWGGGGGGFSGGGGSFGGGGASSSW